MRTVKVYSSKQGKSKSYETSVSTWGDLRSLISEDYDLSNLKAVESVNKTSLEHVDARLPEGDFTLFLRQDKTKSGMDVSDMKFKELRNTVKSLGNDCIKYLNSLKAGKNYTQLSTEDLRGGLANYLSQTTTASVSFSADYRGESSEESDEKTPLERLLKARKKLFKALEEYKDNYEMKGIKDELDSLIEEIEEDEQEDAKPSDTDMEKELRDLEAGFL